jgi:predicted transposase/invertase (TIGR01784 family)
VLTDVFVPPIEDSPFKYIFGRSEASEPQLVGLLSAVLNLPQEEYADVTIGDPHLLRRFKKDKLGIVDIRVKTTSGMILNIEMQAKHMYGMKERVVFYSDRLYTDQNTRLNDETSYAKLKKTISILFTNYREIDDKACHHVFTLYDKRHECEWFDKKELHIVELQKKIEPWDNPALEDWVKFLKARTKEEIEMAAKADPKISAAAKAHQEYSFSKQLRLIYEAKKKERADWYARIGGAREEGKELGIKQGIEQGIAKGKEEGERENKFKVAAKLKQKGMDIAEIADVTGLLPDEIDAL